MTERSTIAFPLPPKLCWHGWCLPLQLAVSQAMHRPSPEGCWRGCARVTAQLCPYKQGCSQGSFPARRLCDACLRTVQNDSLATLLARLEGVLGPVPQRMLRDSRFAHRYYTRSGALFERSPRSVSPPPPRSKPCALRTATTRAQAPSLSAPPAR